MGPGGVSGFPLSATFMKSSQIGRAARLPVEWEPNDLGWSNPIQAMPTSFGVKPANQPSYESLVVPVLPPTSLRLSTWCTRAPVPYVATPRNKLFMTYAVRGSMARAADSPAMVEIGRGSWRDRGCPDG